MNNLKSRNMLMVPVSAMNLANIFIGLLSFFCCWWMNDSDSMRGMY